MRAPNLVDILLVLGLVGLIAAVALPGFQGRRAARIEERADEAARALLQIAYERTPLDLEDAALHTELEEALQQVCKELGHPPAKVPTLVDDQDEPTFETEHYFYRVTRQPEAPGALAQGDIPTRRPLEVYAWPRTLYPPGRTIFFYPEVGPPAFTRNLFGRLQGLDRAPEPGSGERKNDYDRRGGYRSSNDERWLPLNRDPR